MFLHSSGTCLQITELSRKWQKKDREHEEETEEGKEEEKEKAGEILYNHKRSTITELSTIQLKIEPDITKITHTNS
jgi:hypothetical protein